MALLPPDEGATFRQEITIALDEGARYRAEQTVMLEEARANARRAADSWSRRSTFSVIYHRNLVCIWLHHHQSDEGEYHSNI